MDNSKQLDGLTKAVKRFLNEKHRVLDFIVLQNLDGSEYGTMTSSEDARTLMNMTRSKIPRKRNMELDTILTIATNECGYHKVELGVADGGGIRVRYEKKS